MKTRRVTKTVSVIAVAVLTLVVLGKDNTVFAQSGSSGKTIRVSVASDGTQGNKQSLNSSISADGRYVAFASEATNLVSGDTNGTSDVFVRDRETGQTTRVSVSSNGTQGNDWSAGQFGELSISADGRFVAFASSASNLVSGDTNNAWDVFVHDRQTGQTTRVSVHSNGTQGDRGSSQPSISADGRYVAFMSDAWNLIGNDLDGNGFCDPGKGEPGCDTNSATDIFVHDRQTGQTTRVSVSSNGAQAYSDVVRPDSYYPSISADGRYVAFYSVAPNLVSGDTNNQSDIFVHDRQTAQTTRVSVSSNGMEGNGVSFYSSISADGRYVVFESGSSNLVSGDTNGAGDVFVHDRQTGQTTRVSVASDGTQGNSGSGYAAISADGRYVAFASSASNLVNGDTNTWVDIFVHDRQTGQTTRVSVASAGTQGNYISQWPSISADGRYVAFTSGASNLVSGDTNGVGDVFVHFGGLVVNSTGDSQDANTSDGACDTGATILRSGVPEPECTLRAAIMQANALAGTDTITFDIPGWTSIPNISPGSALPTITDAVVIDATTQSAGKVELNGGSAGNNGLRITAGNSTVKGLVVNLFGGHGILLETGGSNVIQGNYIGTDTTGTLAWGNQDGVHILNSANNLIGGTTAAQRNLISGNLSDGIEVEGLSASDNIVAGNYIGTDKDGLNTVLDGIGNRQNGVLINGAPRTTIGGTTTGARNLISGNRANGVYIKGSTATGNKVQGNYFGTDPTGTFTDYFGGGSQPPYDLRNRQDGILIENAPGNTLGGIATSPGAPPGNLISASGSSAIHLKGSNASGNDIQGNLVGTDAAGTGKLTNQGHGVFIEGAPSNTVGGTQAGARNIISGNGNDDLRVFAASTGHGVLISGTTATSNTVQGNYIGTNLTGTEKLKYFLRQAGSLEARASNNGDGIAIQDAPGNISGGTTAAARNLISGNVNGISVIGTQATGNVIQGNWIGTTSTGTNPLGNHDHGVYINADQNRIGGTATGAGNLIAFNGQSTCALCDPLGNGVLVKGARANEIRANTVISNGINGVLIYETTPTVGNVIQSNRIYDNGKLGIDLGFYDGVTFNDLGDSDTGANQLQNWPVITSANTNSGQVYIAGTLNSKPGTVYRLEFFTNSRAGTAGLYQGETLLGTTDVTTNAQGNATFQVNFAGTGGTVTATATDPESNTSEFSLPIISGTISPASGGTVMSSDGSFQIDFPPGAVVSTLTVTYAESPPPTQPLPTGRIGVRYFTLEARDGAGQLVTNFNQPYTMALTYTDAQLAAQGSSEANLNMAFWNGNAWVDLLPCAGCGVDTVNNRVTIVANHFTEFGLIGGNQTASRFFLPFVSRSGSGAAPIPAVTPTNMPLPQAAQPQNLAGARRNLLPGQNIVNLNPRMNTFTNPSTGAQVTIPENLAQPDWTLSMRPLNANELSSLTSGLFGLLGTNVEIIIRDGNGNIVSFLNQPITVCIPFTDSDLNRVGGDVNQLQILRNPGKADQQAITTGRTVNFTTHLICVTTMQLSVWSLAMPRPTALPAPKATAPRVAPQIIPRPTSTLAPTKIAAIPAATATRVLVALRPGELRWTIGKSGGTILDLASGVWLTIPPNILAEEATVFIRALDPNLNAQTEGVRVLKAAEINIRDARGGALTALSQPMRVCFRHSDEQLKQAKRAANFLILQNPGAGNEKELARAQTASPETQMVCAETTGLGVFALAMREPAPAPDNLVETVRTGATIASLALFGGALLLGALAVLMWMRKK